MSAGHRNRADRYAKQRVFSHQRGNTRAGKVLNHAQHAGRRQKYDNRDRAFFKHSQACAETHGGEKADHEKALQTGVQCDGSHSADVKRQVQQRKQQAANNGSRYTEFVQKTDFTNQKFPD
ncbi:hypothetical protein DSECCO2_628860 [anaerobic digester metagenome]